MANSISILGLLSPRLQPEIVTKNGKIFTPTWLPLYYLRNISSTVEFQANDELQGIVLIIIETVSKHNYINNYFNPYTNYFFRKAPVQYRQ